MKILFIAPLSPPITGQSIASDVLLDSIKSNNDVLVINTSKNTFIQGVSSFKRIKDILIIYFKILINLKRTDVIYLTISQSFAGILKDLFILTICFNKINRVVLHSHGMGIKNLIFDKYPFFRSIIAFYFKRVSNLVVLGPTHVNSFESIIDKSKIEIVYNFSNSEIFVDDSRVYKKHKQNSDIINILFLSNLLEGKGFNELIEAVKILPPFIKNKVKVFFAGGFSSNIDKIHFLNNISNISQINYLGIVDGKLKCELFANSHIFCLPTYYKYEGQPISILEAYAAGCSVVTTNHAGIPDIFIDGINGINVTKKSIHDLSQAIEYLVVENDRRYIMGKNNFQYALNNFTKEIYQQKMAIILNKCYNKSNS